MIGAVACTTAVALALVPASAGAGAARPPVALSATPARVVLAGSARTTVRVTNSGTRRVSVDVSRAGFALDLRGRPRIARSSGPRSAAHWLTLRPAHLTIGANSSASLFVAAKVPRRTEPGDHDALVLLSTRPLTSLRVAVRLRMGVVVIVRAPGKVVRRLELRALRLARRARRRALDVVVANRGNVTESLAHARAVVSRMAGGPSVANLIANNRELRPRTNGILRFPLRRQLHGWVTVLIVLPGEPGRPAVGRRYRIRM